MTNVGVASLRRFVSIANLITVIDIRVLHYVWQTRVISSSQCYRRYCITPNRHSVRKCKGLGGHLLISYLLILPFLCMVSPLEEEGNYQ